MLILFELLGHWHYFSLHLLLKIKAWTRAATAREEGSMLVVSLREDTMSPRLAQYAFPSRRRRGRVPCYDFKHFYCRKNTTFSGRESSLKLKTKSLQKQMCEMVQSMVQRRDPIGTRLEALAKGRKKNI